MALHCIILIIVYLMPEQAKKKAEEKFITTLVSPSVVMPPPEKREPPLRRLPPLPPEPAPRVAPRRIEPDRVTPFRHFPRADEKPVLPGEGGVSGGSSTEGTRPGPSSTDKRAGSRRDTAGSKKVPEVPGLLGREKLFDRGVTEEIARKDAGGPGSRTKREDAITFDTNEYRFKGYMSLLRNKIESIWVYPPDEIAAGHYGDLKIRFTIKKDGRLGAVELVRTSGHASLDRAAVKALRDGEPYWPLPDDWGMDSYTILGHFVYSLQGYYLR